jgi:hypothetical protein
MAIFRYSIDSSSYVAPMTEPYYPFTFHSFLFCFGFLTT